MASTKSILKELQKRQEKAEELAKKPVFDFSNFCFDAQAQFFRGEGARFRNAVCSRRAGKTVGIAADAIDTCLSYKDKTCLYVTITKEAARNIIWNDILKIIEDYELDFKIDNLRLSATHRKTRSKIIIAGAKDKTEIEKYRGWKLRKVYLDEAQSFRSYIEYFVNDILTPALRDEKGELYITGTPGAIKAGYFYKISQSDFWYRSKWTAFNNPHMHDPDNGKDLEETLAEEREMKQIDASDPGYIRETYGEWVEDTNSLVFKFDKAKNIFHTKPEGNFSYIFGIDIGYNDSDAIAVLAFNKTDKKVFLVEEHVRNKQNITQLVEAINNLRDKYDPIKMVIDAGALGKKIQEEIRSRHNLPLHPAEKTRKHEFIELLNDDLRTGKFSSFENSLFEEDCYLVQWDLESRMKNPEKPKISTSYHSDICDAVLYAWRECKHFHAEAEKVAPKSNTDEYMQYLEQKEMERWEQQQDPEFGQVSDEDLDYIFEDT